MRRHAVGLMALVLVCVALALPARADHRFGFHESPFVPRPFFFHHHRPFFFRHSFFRPFFGFGIGVPAFYPAPVVVYPPAPYSPYPPTSCQLFQSTVVINGQPQPAYGTACLEPDGTWHIMP